MQYVYFTGLQVHRPGNAQIQGEVRAKQEQFYRDLGVTPLLSAPENR